MDHRFSGTPFTIGIEEELMLIDEASLDLAQGIESILRDVEHDGPGQVKPELMQSVLEIATDPCPDLPSARQQLREIRRRVRDAAARNGMLLGAAGTHPTAHWEDQLIVERPRYQELAEELGWIARQELIFGTHVHVGVNGPDRAIYVADGIRRHLPLLLAISANSPLWRGEVTGMMSSRTPIFRHFPRVGIPPHYGSWEIFNRRVEVMRQAGVIADYTYLWWDVRPHPNLGTVEVRVFDQQTSLNDTISLAALALCLVHRYVSNFDEGKPLVEVPTELIDDNKVRAAIRGLEGEIVDLPHSRQAPALELAEELVDELEPDSRKVGCEEELQGVRAIARDGTRACKQLEVLERDGMEALIRHLAREVSP
jgi:glutamate---cysteine ligase / carboxylate-amine ligase